MGSRFHASRMRRAERHAAAGHGSINLVPLIDILTSIVFFSLLTYSGAVNSNGEVTNSPNIARTDEIE